MTTKTGLSQRIIDLPNLGEDLESARLYRADKTKAYREGFQEFESMAIPTKIAGKKYRVHPNVNLYIDMTPSCNGNCAFCIAKVQFGRRRFDEHNKCAERLGKALTFLHQAGVKHTVQVTGGEPTLHMNSLADVLRVISSRSVPKPVLNTNGSYPLHYQLYSKLQHVNISRHHYNENDNRRIIRGVKISDNDLLANIVKPMREKVRLQCNMIGGEIDTYGEVMQFIAFAYHKLGVTNVAFALLTPLPNDSFYDPSIIEYVNKRPVDADAILERVEKDNRFSFEKYRGGVACYYEVWKFTAYENPMTIIFKYSDNYWLEKADNDPELLPDMILHTDGTLAGSWCRDRKVLAKF